MVLTPLNYLFVYTLASLGLILIGVRYLWLWFAGLLLLIIPIEVILRFIL